ncbi:alpha-glucan family phosphorylase [soil metagenome]
MKTFDLNLPYNIDQKYAKKIAYFSPEFAIHQPLKTYAGNVGYLTGSFLRSAYALKQDVIGIGILWKYGYYDQIRKNDLTMDVQFQEKNYKFLEDVGIKFTVPINNKEVYVKAYYLAPQLFKTAPLFLLSTDLPENDYLSQSITHKLYDIHTETRMASHIVLGVGGANFLEIINYEPDFYNLNEVDALPLAFHLYKKLNNAEDVKNKIVFTDHSPDETTDLNTVKSFNTDHTPNESVSQTLEFHQLEKMNYFSGLSQEQIEKLLGKTGQLFNPNQAAIQIAKTTIGNSILHKDLLQQFYPSQKKSIQHITASQNFNYWADKDLYEALKSGDADALNRRKKLLKKLLFEEVADLTGHLFDENHLTLVWARRFSNFRRPDLILQNLEKLQELLNDKVQPVQIIFAGKPHPMDYTSITIFDKLINVSKEFNNLTVLTGLELKLSKLLKGGADLWLNTSSTSHEASETSCISAAMNGCINFSTNSSWIPEFSSPGVNSFILSPVDPYISDFEQNKNDNAHLMDFLKNEVIPMYYNNPAGWTTMMKRSMKDIIPYFDSDRLVKEYYEKIYNADAANISVTVNNNNHFAKIN